MPGARHNQRAADPTTLAPVGGQRTSWLPVLVLTGSMLAAVWAVAMLTAPGRVAVAYAFYFLQFYAGVFALVSLTITVLAGLGATDRLVLMVRHRVLLQSVHRTLGTLAVVFLVAHILTKVMYSAVPAIGAVVPFIGGNRPVYVGLGVIAGYLMFAVFWTGIARARFIGVGKPWMWRSLHATVYLSWPMALVHGLSAGRPAAGWVTASYLACALAVTILLVIRVSTALQRRSRGQSATTGSMKPVGKPAAGPSAAGTGSGFRYVAESDIRAAYAPREPRQPSRQPTAHEQRAASYEQLGGRTPREYQTEDEFAAAPPDPRGPRSLQQAAVARVAPQSAPRSAPRSAPPRSGRGQPVDDYGVGDYAPAQDYAAQDYAPAQDYAAQDYAAQYDAPVSSGGRRTAPEPAGYRDDYREADYREPGYPEPGYREAQYREGDYRDAPRRASGRRGEYDHRAAEAEFPASSPPRRRFEESYGGSDHSATSYSTGGYAAVGGYAAAAYSATDHARSADPVPSSPPPTGTPWRESTGGFAAVPAGPPPRDTRGRSARHSLDGEATADDAARGTYASSSYPAGSYPSAYESSYQEPTYPDPSRSGPSYPDPSYQEPSYQDPGYQDPSYQEPSYEDQNYVPPDDTPTLIDMASARAARASRQARAPRESRATRESRASREPNVSAGRSARRRGSPPAAGGGGGGGGGGGEQNLSDEEYWAQLRGEAR